MARKIRKTILLNEVNRPEQIGERHKAGKIRKIGIKPIQLEEIKYERSENAPKHGPWWYWAGSKKEREAADEKIIKKAAKKFLPSMRGAIKETAEKYGFEVNTVLRTYMLAMTYRVPGDKLGEIFREAAQLKLDPYQSLLFELESGKLIKHYKFKYFLKH